MKKSFIELIISGIVILGIIIFLGAAFHNVYTHFHN